MGTVCSVYACEGPSSADFSSDAADLASRAHRAPRSTSRSRSSSSRRRRAASVGDRPVDISFISQQLLYWNHYRFDAQRTAASAAGGGDVQRAYPIDHFFLVRYHRLIAPMSSEMVSTSPLRSRSSPSKPGRPTTAASTTSAPSAGGGRLGPQQQQQQQPQLQQEGEEESRRARGYSAVAKGVRTASRSRGRVSSAKSAAALLTEHTQENVIADLLLTSMRERWRREWEVEHW